MSNVIKAYNIRYTEEKKKLDTNARAEEFQRLYIEGLPKMIEVEEPLDYEVEEHYFQEEASDNQEEKENNHGERMEVRGKGISEESKEELDRLVEEARQNANALMQNAQNEAERILSEAREKIKKEKEATLAEAKDRGYKEGKQTAENELEQLKKKLEQQIRDNQLAYEKQVEELEPAFVEIVASLIKKLTGVILEDRRDLVLHVIHQGMLGIENSNNFIIRVSKDDFDFVNSRKNDILYELQGSSVEIITDPILQRAQCTIETDTRIIDCSLDVQLKNLVADLKLLSGIL